MDCPFPELVDFMNSEENDLVLMPKNKYMHVPYVVILYKYLEDWKKTHDGNFPQNWKEKREIRDIIKNSKYFLFISHYKLTSFRTTETDSFMIFYLFTDFKPISNHNKFKVRIPSL